MATITAYAPEIRIESLAGTYRVYCVLGKRLGRVEVVRGFAHYYGAEGGAHEGIQAVIGGGLDGLRRALAVGVRNGRDDRE